MKFLAFIITFLVIFCIGFESSFAASCTSLLGADQPRARLQENSESYYYWSSSPDSNFFIEGQLINGVLNFGIKLKNFHSDERSERRGVELFDEMIAHFGLHNIRLIRDEWLKGDNYEEFFLNLKSMGEEQAAKNTWTGRRAAKYGFKRVKVLRYSTLYFKTGRYAFVEFSRPSFSLKDTVGRVKKAWSLDFLDD